MLHLGTLSVGERMLDIDAEVADCALDLRMAARRAMRVTSLWAKAPVNQHSESSSETAFRVDLGSFPKSGVAVVFGSGGIGAALLEDTRS
jgi:hypothetical protein